MLTDQETVGLNSKNPDLFIDSIHPDKVWPCPDASVVSNAQWIGENSGAQPNGSSASSSTNFGAICRRQRPGECPRETLDQLAPFLPLALQQHGQQSALRKSRC